MSYKDIRPRGKMKKNNSLNPTLIISILSFSIISFILILNGFFYQMILGLHLLLNATIDIR